MLGSGSFAGALDGIPKRVCFSYAVEYVLATFDCDGACDAPGYKAISPERVVSIEASLGQFFQCVPHHPCSYAYVLDTEAREIHPLFQFAVLDGHNHDLGAQAGEVLLNRSVIMNVRTCGALSDKCQLDLHSLLTYVVHRAWSV